LAGWAELGTNELINITKVQGNTTVYWVLGTHRMFYQLVMAGWTKWLNIFWVLRVSQTGTLFRYWRKVRFTQVLEVLFTLKALFPVKD